MTNLIKSLKVEKRRTINIVEVSFYIMKNLIGLPWFWFFPAPFSFPSYFVLVGQNIYFRLIVVRTFNKSIFKFTQKKIYILRWVNLQVALRKNNVSIFWEKRSSIWPRCKAPPPSLFIARSTKLHTKSFLENFKGLSTNFRFIYRLIDSKLRH